jgi:hypothetical protein
VEEQQEDLFQEVDLVLLEVLAEELLQKKETLDQVELVIVLQDPLLKVEMVELHLHLEVAVAEALFKTVVTLLAVMVVTEHHQQ